MSTCDEIIQVGSLKVCLLIKFFFTQALEKKNGEHFHRRKIFLDVSEKARGRPKYVDFPCLCKPDSSNLLLDFLIQKTNAIIIFDQVLH